MTRPWDRLVGRGSSSSLSEDEEEGDPRIRISFEIITPESAEQGDAAERGWEDEDGQSMLPDEDDDEEVTVVSNAVKFLRDQGGTEPSSTSFHRGLWYRQPDADINYRTGEAKYLSFHLVDFSEEEEREIFETLHGSTDILSARSRAHRKWTRR